MGRTSFIPIKANHLSQRSFQVLAIGVVRDERLGAIVANRDGPKPTTKATFGWINKVENVGNETDDDIKDGKSPDGKPSGPIRYRASSLRVAPSVTESWFERDQA